jgi:predicted RNase H-like nuclease (RuvC/YqgF family)
MQLDFLKYIQLTLSIHPLDINIICPLLFNLILISYKLMQQGTFKFIKEDSPLDNMQMLEEKITKVIDKIRVLTEENVALNEKIAGLQQELDNKEDEIKAFKGELKGIDSLRIDIDRLNSERETVRSHVENLIRELESVEM